MVRDLAIGSGTGRRFISDFGMGLQKNLVAVYGGGPRGRETLIIIQKDDPASPFPERRGHPEGYYTSRHPLWNADLARAVVEYLESTGLGGLAGVHRDLVESFIRHESNARQRRQIEDHLRKNPERIPEVAAMLGLPVA